MNQNLIMITGLGSAEDLARGKKGAFYNTLEEFHKYWNRIDIIAPRITNYELRITNLFGNVHIHTSPWPLVFHPWFFLKEGMRLHKKYHFDLMTVQDFPPFYNGIGAYLLSLATRVPYILEIMHVPGLPKAGSSKELIYKYLTKFFIRFDARHARAVRVINQKQTKDFLIEAGVPANKIKYIPAFYIDLDIFKPEPIEKKYDIVYAARLERNKGVLNLIKAIEIIRQKIPEIKACIIGDGPMRAEIENYIREHRLENNIELTGWLAGPQDVARRLNQSRIFVNPAFNEGGPRVALEAMACGIPVITTKVGIMLDIIKDGENGVFSGWSPQNLTQAAGTVLDSPALADSCAQAGLRTADQFERKSSIRHYAEFLHHI